MSVAAGRGRVPAPEGGSAPSGSSGWSARDGAGERIRVTHVISGLELGGAETMLYRLLDASDRARFEHSVISLSSFGPLAPSIAALEVRVSALGMRRGRLQARPLGRLARGLASRRPHVVHTWMDHANLLGGLLARAGRGPRSGAKVLWGVHGSLHPRESKRSSRVTSRACTVIARRVPDRVVSCSQRLAEMLVEQGYDAGRMTVIPNGFDLSWFRPEPARGRALRAQLGVGETETIVGLAGRYHPQKDHRSFVRAAGIVARARADVRFLLCGSGVEGANRELMGWIAQAGIAQRCILLGPVADMRDVFNAIDLLVCSSSFGEAFPLVLGEAMACGLPCVTTAVGDAAAIVGDAGRVVPIRDPGALAEEILSSLSMSPAERQAAASAARARIEERYDLAAVTTAFERLYLDLCGGAFGSPPAGAGLP
ncbi:MAG TPA: glycosyltransferase [Solirubrobacteraceae bacterium]